MTVANYQPSNDDVGYHVKLSIKGDAEKVFFFNRVIGSCDNDWPFTWRYDEDTKTGYIVPKTYLICPKCGGVFYRSPRVMPRQLRAIAEQLACTVKVRSYRGVKNCFDHHGVKA